MSSSYLFDIADSWCIDWSAARQRAYVYIFQNKLDLIQISELNGMKIFTMRFTVFSLPILLALMPVDSARAETRYISDQLVINIKDRLEQPYTVVAKVRSDEAVNVLEENDTYARVETEGKQVGWIAKQYLTTTVPKTAVIEQLRKELETIRTQGQPSEGGGVSPQLAELQKERDRLQLELQSAQSRIAELQEAAAQPEAAPASSDPATLSTEVQDLLEKRAQLEAEIAQLRSQIESLSDGNIDIEALAQEKDKLLKENQAKDERIAALTAENQKLTKKTTLYWFCAGALVFLAGMFSGKISGRKKTKYSY